MSTSRSVVTAWYGNTRIARSERTVHLEGNYYFPAEDVREGIFSGSWLRTLCYWKGLARYHHADIDGVRLRNAAWSYPHPSPLARRIKGMVAFEPRSGVTVRVEKQ